MSKFDQVMNRGGLGFWCVVLLTFAGLWGFLFLTMSLGSLFL